MPNAKLNSLKNIGNENSYTKDFYKQLFSVIGAKNKAEQANLSRSIILAAQTYITSYRSYHAQLPSHEVQKELKKAISHLDKAAEALIKVYASGNYGAEIIDNLHDVISKKYPSLSSILHEIKKEHGDNMTVTSPVKSLNLIEAIADGIDATLKNYNSPETTTKSEALHKWIMIIAAQLEPIIGHKFEQSRYYKTSKGAEYISKKKINDSELLLLIIKPLDPNVTVSQIETAIKETRKERHESPWHNYFPHD